MKKLISQNYQQVATFKRNFEKARPIYDELVEHLEGTGLLTTDPKIVEKLTKKIIGELKETLPGVSDMELLRMKGQSDFVFRIREILDTLTNIELYASEKALNDHIKDELYIYTTEPQAIEMVETILMTVNIMENKWGMSKNAIQDFFRPFGAVWGYGQERLEFKKYDLERRTLQLA